MFLDSGCVAGVSVQLFNSNGQIYSMSIAGDFVTSVLPRILDGKFDIPKFGIKIQPGLILSMVMENSEWKKAGIMEGDKLIRINGREIKKHQDIIKVFTQIKKDDTYQVVVERDGAFQLFEIVSKDRMVPERDLDSPRRR